jgi:hypothetical protein
MKKEVKDEPEEMPAAEDEWPWWVKELALADATRHLDDPADEPGLHVLQARSFNEAQPTTALVWSAEQSGVLVDITKDDDAMPQVKEE